MSAKVGFVCISCLLSDLVGKSVRELTWNAEEKEGKCCFNHIFVNNHLRLYIMVFFYLHHVHVFGTSSCLIDWNMLTWNVSMKSNISELLELLFFSFFFLYFQRNWPCECSYLACCVFTFRQFQVFFIRKVFLYTSENILQLNNHRSHLKRLQFFYFFLTLNYFTIAALFLYVFIHDSKATWLQKVIPKGASVQILSIFKKKTFLY